MITIRLIEHGRWDLGFRAGVWEAGRELSAGSALGVLLIGGAALFIDAVSGLAHRPGSGFPLAETALVFLPAVLHEELLFRGYAFQKLRAWNRAAALLLFAVVFAALHARNPSVTLIGLGNIALGGILLGLAYERYLRLWFPIGLHLAWNLMTGPVLGHEVSGYEPGATLLVETGQGPAWLTGGEFGLEGSVILTIAEAAAIARLWKKGTTRAVR
jgi:membrane protease YdiL (CAAX protease family)